jgi:hypothetical protein
MSANKGGITLEFKSNTKAADSKIEAALKRALDRIAIKWQAEAKLAAPVDTGRLRASIAFSTPTVSGLHTETYSTGVVQYDTPPVKGLTVQVGTNVEYALAVHEGLESEFAYRSGNQTKTFTIQRKPNKFIEDPGRALAGEFRGFIEKEIRKATGGTQGRLP